VLGQFAMVNVELLNLVEDIKPILKVFVVYPKNVNAENSTSNTTVTTFFFLDVYVVDLIVWKQVCTCTRICEWQ
jgi:hypothetical protein